MTSLGFTGTQRGMTEPQRRALVDVLDRFPDRDRFHHGDCVGADEQAHAIAAERGWTIYVHPPFNSSKRAWCSAHVGYATKPYLQRNDAIVAASDLLLAAPSAPEDHPSQRRSGTWYTVRRAKRESVPVTIVWPDGRVEEGRERASKIEVHKL